MKQGEKKIHAVLARGGLWRKSKRNGEWDIKLFNFFCIFFSSHNKNLKQTRECKQLLILLGDYMSVREVETGRMPTQWAAPPPGPPLGPISQLPQQ